LPTARFPAEQLGAIIDLIKATVISGKIAKDVFEIVWTEGGDPAQIVEDRGMKQVTDTGAIEAAVDEVIAANPDKVEQAKAKPNLAGWFVGQVMKATGGKANPQAVQDSGGYVRRCRSDWPEVISMVTAPQHSLGGAAGCASCAGSLGRRDGWRCRGAWPPMLTVGFRRARHLGPDVQDGVRCKLVAAGFTGHLPPVGSLTC
jgi:hypothetical protein